MSLLELTKSVYGLRALGFRALVVGCPHKSMAGVPALERCRCFFEGC